MRRKLLGLLVAGLLTLGVVVPTFAAISKQDMSLYLGSDVNVTVNCQSRLKVTKTPGKWAYKLTCPTGYDDPTPQDTPAPTPQPTTKPTPPPIVAADTQSWDIGFVIYQTVDAVCQGQHVFAQMTSAEVATAKAAAAEMAGYLNSWNPDLHVTSTVEVRPTLSQVTTNGDGCWAAKSDVPQVAGADTTVVFLDMEQDGAANGDWWYPTNVMGISTLCGTCAGYSTVVGTQKSQDYMAEVAVHEWLHPTSSFYKAKGYNVPDPHAQLTYDPTHAWSALEWYRREVAADLPDLDGDGQPDGITLKAIEGAGSPNGR